MKSQKIAIILVISLSLIFIINPILKFILGTSHPLAIIENVSMQHNSNFDGWWEKSKGWYIKNGINKDDFETFPQKNGFNIGDILIVKGTPSDEIKIGDTIIFLDINGTRISHRVGKYLHKLENTYL